MLCYKMALLFFIIFLNYLFVHVSALSKEAIMGGIESNIYSEGYIVSIQGRTLSNELPVFYFPLCTGGIVHPRFVLSAAHCFVESSGGLLQYRFSILAGVSDLNDPNGIRIDVQVIYLPGYEITFSVFNIAVVQLAADLLLGIDNRLNILQLPPHNADFGNSAVTVSGYGFDWIELGTNATGQTSVLTGSSTGLLRYGDVFALEDEECERLVPGLVPVSQLCGYMYNNMGVCTGDDGAPLVLNGIIIGVLSKYNVENCNDSIAPAIYTKVAAFTLFIENLFQGNQTFAIVFRNRNIIEIVNID